MSWPGESRRHEMSRRGIKTVIDENRRFDVSTFVTRGYNRTDMVETDDPTLIHLLGYMGYVNNIEEAFTEMFYENQFRDGDFDEKLLWTLIDMWDDRYGGKLRDSIELQLNQEGVPILYAKGIEQDRAEMEMAMKAFNQVQDAKRKRIEQQHQHELRMNTFTWAQMDAANKQAVTKKYQQPGEDFTTAMRRIQNKTFDQRGNIIN